MSVEEQEWIAKEMGRLAAWHGQTCPPKFIYLNPTLVEAWSRGHDGQRVAMRAEAKKVPLTWPDQKNNNRAD